MFFLLIFILIIFIATSLLAVANFNLISNKFFSSHPLLSQLYLLAKSLVEKFIWSLHNKDRLNQRVLLKNRSSSLLSLRSSHSLGQRRYSTTTTNKSKSKVKSSRRKRALFKWHTLPDYRGVNEIILDKSLVEKLIKSFWQKVFYQNQDEVILIQLVLITGDKTYNSISKLITVGFEDLDQTLLFAIEGYMLQYQHYSQYPISGIFIKYVVLPKDSPRTIHYLNSKEKAEYNKSESYSLPTTLDLQKWGKILFISKELAVIQKGAKTYTINFDGNIRNVTLNVSECELCSFTDEIINLQNDEFIRDDGKVKIYFKGGVEVRREEINKNTIFMSGKPKDDTEPTDKFITLDLETRAIGIGENCNLQVVSAVTYDGEKYSTYFINDFINASMLVLRLLTDLFIKNNNGKTVYVHNLSGFDAMFLVKTLSNNFEDFKIIRKDDKIISLSVSKTVGYTETTITKNGEDVTVKEPEKVILTFADSLLLLPSSLKSLGMSFGVENKGEYDHTKTNFCCTTEDFESIRNEILLYNKQDCLVLYQVILKFKKLVFELWKVNIDNIYTISSIALQVYRSNYFPD